MPRACFGSILLLGLACTGPPPGPSARPALGASIESLLEILPHPEEPGVAIDVLELRLLAVDAQPWRVLEPATAAREVGRVALVAGRRCTLRKGLRRTRVERASWFLFRAGRLVALDHQGFAAGCATRSLFEPASGDEVVLERMLVRYVSQRFPLDAIRAEERLARGLRLLERSRPADALLELHALDRQLAELARRQSESETSDPAVRQALREEEERLRPQRAELQRAIREESTSKTGELR